MPVFTTAHNLINNPMSGRDLMVCFAIALFIVFSIYGFLNWWDNKNASK